MRVAFENRTSYRSVVLMSSCRMISCSTTGGTNSAHRVPNALRRSCAVANFTYPRGRMLLYADVSGLADPGDHNPQPVMRRLRSSSITPRTGKRSKHPPRPIVDGSARRKSANSGAIGSNRSRLPFSNSAKICSLKSPSELSTDNRSCRSHHRSTASPSRRPPGRRRRDSDAGVGRQVPNHGGDGGLEHHLKNLEHHRPGFDDAGRLGTLRHLDLQACNNMPMSLAHRGAGPSASTSNP